MKLRFWLILLLLLFLPLQCQAVDKEIVRLQPDVALLNEALLSDLAAGGYLMKGGQ